MVSLKLNEKSHHSVHSLATSLGLRVQLLINANI